MCIFSAIVSFTIYVHCKFFWILFFCPFSIGMHCCFENFPLGLLDFHTLCVPHMSLCMFQTCVGHWCCIHTTNINSCYCISSQSDLLATVVFASCIVYMVDLSCWFFLQRFMLLPRPFCCIIWIETSEFDLPVVSTVLKSYHFVFSAW